MLSKGQLRQVREIISSKKARKESGLFLIEGAKFVKDARGLIEYSFTENDVPNFRELISTETPQSIAAVARIPKWTIDQVKEKKTILVLDGVQDPGNVGTILRACLAFDASLILVESADPTNPKTVRSSAASILKTPWLEVSREEIESVLQDISRPIYKLELRDNAIAPHEIPKGPIVLIGGNEGRGISIDVKGQSVAIPQNRDLESLNVAMAVSIALYEIYL